ncbi:hypothetical protein [Bradyrhizobium sp. CCBAU 051011]|uniref:hypothetical protein n=1 Tax=Bradyrhizobium sp. CCBAU 051011 TaxID=858422 RepID=UPI001379D3C2|nr:hypothetical protein [Bradyrhizobium sp. CCBAU 051011]
MSTMTMETDQVRLREWDDALWSMAAVLIPASWGMAKGECAPRRVIEKLLARGWIEWKPLSADRVLYRNTEKGTTAKKARIPQLTLPAKARR